jgi:hypothetical protein
MEDLMGELFVNANAEFVSDSKPELNKKSSLHRLKKWIKDRDKHF